MLSRLASKIRKAYHFGVPAVVLTNFSQRFLPENRQQAPSIMASSSGNTGWQEFSCSMLKTIPTSGFAMTQSLWMCMKKATTYILQPPAATQANMTTLFHSFLLHAMAHPRLSGKLWAFPLKDLPGKTGDSLLSTSSMTLKSTAIQPPSTLSIRRTGLSLLELAAERKASGESLQELTLPSQ